MVGFKRREILQRMEGRFDRVVSRAFSDLSTFLILSYPFLKERGIALAMKGELKGEEAVDSREGEKGPLSIEGRPSLSPFRLPP